MNNSLKEKLKSPFVELADRKKQGKKVEHSIHRKELYHGFCPPGYEKVRSYKKEDGTRVEEHCRRIKVSGRTGAAIRGIYNEGMIAQEDTRLGFDSVFDMTREGEANASKIHRRSEKIRDMMQDQERKKEEIRRTE